MHSESTTLPTPVRPRRRNTREWLTLALTVVLLATMTALWQWRGHRRIEADETARLSGQARAIELNLARQLFGAYAALQDVRHDLDDWRPAERELLAGQRLEALCHAMPGVRTMLLLDAAGRVVASNQAGRIGQDDGAQPYFATLRQRHDVGQLYVSEPFRSASGVHSLNLSIVLTGPGGEFAGAITATLDPPYFDTLLSSALYADDMWASILHGHGGLLVSSPPDDALAGLNMARPGSMFIRHRDSGQVATVLSDISQRTGNLRLVALRTLQPSGLPMDQPLVVSVSRSDAALYASWQRDNLSDAALLASAALIAAAALSLHQRRRAELERLTSTQLARSAADAERLALALRGADLALWDAHLPSGTGTVNDRWFEMLGYAPGEIGADEAHWAALLHPDDRARVLAAQAEHIQGRVPAFEASYRLRHKDGHWLWVLDRGRVVERDGNGKALRFVGTHMDISQRMQAEETLRHNEESLAITLHSIGDAVVATDKQGCVMRLNATAERLLGWTAQRAVGRPLGELFQVFDAQTRAPLCDPVTRVLACGHIVEMAQDTLLVTSDGRELQIADSAAPIRAADGEVVGVVLVFSDVSGHYRMLRALRESEARLRIAGRLARLGGWRLELGTRTLTGSPELSAIFELGDEQTLPRPGYQFVDPADRGRLDVHLRACGENGTPFDLELRALSASGLPLQLRVIGEAVRDAAGRIVSLQGAAQDISELHRTDAAMRAAQQELAATLDAVPDLLFDVDAEGRIHGYHSPRSDLLLLAPEQFMGRRIDELMPPAAAAVQAQALQQAQDQGWSSGLQYELPLAGGTRSFELSVAPRPMPPGEPLRFVVLARDITERQQADAERRALERQLREAQKMESIGTLAGGIAHDFNNILAAILGNVALARSDLPEGHAALASLDQINKASLRARTLVQQILTFSRRRVDPLLAQPLRPVVEETLALLRSTLPAALRLETRLADEPLLVQADATQLQQVLMNLCTNAWHALRDRPGATGLIEVGIQALPAMGMAGDPSPLAEARRGPCVHLWVRDNGSGIDAATRERIFDPFFTTKPVGQGTGLGLSVVHGIVRGHHGAIAVDSTPGVGSCFHVYLPRVAAAGAGAAATAAGDTAAAPGHGEQLLYVDDDEVMVLMVQRLLEREGYAPTVCGSAAQALALVRAQPGRFDLVISDYNMPETSGLELARLLLQSRPGLPVIITSGYLTDELRDQAAALGVSALLQKEQTLEVLPALVHKALAAA